MSATTWQPRDSASIVLHRALTPSTRNANGVLRYSGLFDIFPETYWARFTTLKSVILRCRLRAPAMLRLIRRQADGSGEEILASQAADSGGEIVLITPLTASTAADSYLLMEIVPVASQDDPLVSATWETAQPRERIPCVGVAITTFNREPFLIANLRRLRGRMAGGCIIVVNHGEPELKTRLHDSLPPDLPVRWIDQENSGGAGGFTRGMTEHHATGNVTHVLLTDDDIDLREDLVERATAILSYTRSNICLGGAMFDYYRRSCLFSAGDILLPGNFGIGHVVAPEGCDIATTPGVDFLARAHSPDFNGWWCFAFPIEALDRVGLPMPCFIRGDDVEYGYRLKRAGMPTLGWPGLAVWHMPFADKSVPWHMFYDRRNSLFANARHRRIGRLAAVNALAGGFIHHLLRYDYDRVRAMTLGIDAFNMGAEKMARWNQADHAALIAATSQMQGLEANAAAGPTLPRLTPKRLSGVARDLYMTWRIILDLVGIPIGNKTPRHLPPGEAWRPDFTLRPAVIVEYNREGRAVRTYRRNSAESRRAIARYIKAVTGMILRFHQPVPFAFPKSRCTSHLNADKDDY